MSHFITQSHIFDYPIRLTKEEQAAPLTVLKKFIQDYPLSDMRHNLREIEKACITSDNDQFSDPQQRSDLLELFGRMESMLEAVFLTVQQQVQGGEQASV